MVYPRTYFVQPGQRFGRLVVLREIPGVKRPVECACDCGSTLTVMLLSLKNGNTRSCGCLQRDTVAANGRAGATHGLTHHPLYQTWCSMMHRCYNEKRHGYRSYGGRGITVCAEWQNPAAFIDWIEVNLGPRPVGLTLDRKDNDGNYEPGNVRWATPVQQSHNSRRTRLNAAAVREIRAADGKPGITRSVLAARFGVSVPTVSDVVKRRTWKHAP